MKGKIMMTSDERAEHILCAAVALAERVGLNNVRRDNIAEEAGCATGLVSMRLGSMKAIQDAIVSRAIQDENLQIIAQGITMNNAAALQAPRELRTKAMLSQIDKG